MIRVNVMVEGQAEEAFVHEVLVEHFSARGIYLNAMVFETSQGFKGGVVSYAKIKRQIRNKCRHDRSAMVTTLIDLYGLPTDFPDFNACQQLLLYPRVTALERAFRDDIGETNFIANFLVHEFEALLFSDINALSESYPTSHQRIDALNHATATFASPEHINDSPQTAPSKRILAALPAYEKITDGNLAALEIGLDTLRNRCSHFNAWCHRIEQLATPAPGQP